MSQEQKERRQHKRYHTSELFSLNSSIGITNLLDISAGGFSFKSFSKDPLLDESLADIFDKSGQHLKDFPVQKVWSIVRENSIFCMEVGVKFINLDLSQQFELQNMIDSLPENLISAI